MRSRWIPILALLLVACAEPEQRAAEHVQRGERELDEDDLAAAQLEFQSALRFQPGDAALYIRIADLLYEDLNAYRASLPYYREALRIDPDSIHAKMREARLVAFDDPQRAREIVDSELVYKRGSNPIVLRTDAYLKLLENDLNGALISAREAVRLDETSAPNWAELAAVYLAKISARRERGEDPGVLLYGLALGAYDKIEELRGGAYPRARLEKARVYWFQGSRQRGRLLFIDAVNLAKQQGKRSEIQFAIQTVVEYARRAGDFDLTRRMLREAVEFAPGDYSAWGALADATDQLPGHSGEEVLLELIERDPDAAAAHIVYADWLLRRQRAEDAELHLRSQIERGVDAPALGERLVWLALRRGDLAGARAAWAELAESDATARATRLAEARIALAEERLEDAVTLLSQLSEEQSQYEIERLLALAYRHRGELLEARRAAGRALELAPPPRAAALRLRAEIDLERRDWRRALLAFQQILDAGETLTAAEQADRALALVRLGRIEQGRELLEPLVEARPPVPRVAIVFWRLEGESQAERAYRALARAQSLWPTHHELLSLLTELDLAAGDVETAEARLSRLVDQALADPFTLLLRAEVLAAREAWSDAELDVLRALEANPALPGTIDLLHRLYVAQGKLGEALRSFEQADEVGVLHAGARQLLARLYQDQGDSDRARQTLERVVEEAPDLWTARADLALLLAEQPGEIGRAVELATEAARDARGSAYASRAAARVALSAGDHAAALEHLDAAIEAEGAIVPPALHYWRGLALRGLGRDEEAAAAFEHALAAGSFPEADAAREQLEAARHSGASEPGNAS